MVNGALIVVQMLYSVFCVGNHSALSGTDTDLMGRQVACKVHELPPSDKSFLNYVREYRNGRDMKLRDNIN